MGIEIKIIGQSGEINLKEFTIRSYYERFDPVEQFNEEIGKETHGLEFSGEMNLYDTTGEVAEVCKLSEWSKKTANDNDTYRKMLAVMKDSNGNEYDRIEFMEAFVVRYEESFSVDKGNMSFKVFIRDKEPASETITV